MAMGDREECQEAEGRSGGQEADSANWEAGPRQNLGGENICEDPE